MELRNLSAFMKAAEEQNITRAAKQLGYAQSTVTMQIRQLEQELGVELFERIGKQLRITDKGEELLEIAGRIMTAANEAKALGRGQEQAEGKLRLGIVESLQNFVFPRIMHRLHREYPGISLVVKASDCDTLKAMLLRNEIDLMYVLDRRIRDPLLVTAYEKKEQMYFVASTGNALCGREGLTLEDILSQEIIQTEKTLSYGRELNAYVARQGYTFSSYLEIGNPSVIIRLVAQNDGITFAPEYAVEEALRRGRLARVNYQIPEIEMWQQVIYHKNKWVTAGMKAFISMTAEEAFRESACV